MKAAYTLIEVLLTFAVIAILAALLIPATNQFGLYAARTKAVSNLRQIGIAAHLYASDHNQQFPGRASASDPLSPPPDQWPTLFCAYLSPSDPRVFLDLTDANASQLPAAQVISSAVNNTGYVYNGFDDLGVDNQPPAAVGLARLDNPGEVVLLSQKQTGASAFCVDLLLQPLGLLPGLLNNSAFNGGSPYLFADGSVRFLKQADYSNSLWLVDKTTALPPLPLPTPLPSRFLGVVLAPVQ